MTAWLLMQCGARHLALPVSRVRSVAPAVAARNLPRAPAWVEGLAGYGRDIVPQVDLAALLGETDNGAFAVVAESGAGKIALRVRAAERVVDLSAQDAAGDSGALVAATVRRGRQEIGLLDLSGLAIPVLDLPHPVRFDTGSADARSAGLQGGDGRAGELELVCESEGRRIALALAQVLQVERAGSDRVLLHPLGRGRTAAAMAVTLGHGGGNLVLGFDAVVGLRRAGTSGASAIDLDALAGAATAERAAGEAAAAGREADRPRALYLLGAGDRMALVPGAKAMRVGPADHWRDLQGMRGGPSGMVPVDGDILPVVDLAALFGEPSRRRAMVMAIRAGERPWAIACDSISERHARIEGRPATVRGLATLGEARLAEGMVPVLDADRLQLGGAMA